MKNSTEVKTYIRFYWKVWLVLVSLLLVVRFLVFNGTDENSVFLLFAVYAGSVWLAVIVLNIYEAERLLRYIKKNHAEKWKEIVLFPNLGVRGLNPIRYLPFLFSKDNLNDDMVLKLKNNYKSFMKLAVAILLSFLALFLVVMLPASR
jgi:hypothetical protein